MSGLTWLHTPSESRRGLAISEERANQLTHAAAVPLTVVGTVLLVQSAVSNGDSRLINACLIYGASLIAVYLFSTLSHSFSQGRWLHVFRTLDQVSIFALISGNFTPVGMMVCRDGAGWTILAAMWTLSTIGILTKLFITKRENVSFWFYFVLGWLPLLSMGPVSDWFPIAGLLWIIAGAVLYSVGTYFFTNDTRVPYFHTVWHVLVVGGSACHFVVIYCYLIPGLT